MITFDHATNAPFVVKRNGNVIVDGVSIGGVAKIVDYWGVGVWTLADVAGNTVARHYRTQREAAQTLVRLTAAPTVTGIELLPEPTYFGDATGRVFLKASVTWQGVRWGVSRYPNEARWIADSYTVATAVMPTYSNGAGTRVTLTHGLPDEVEDFVNAETHRAGWDIDGGEWTYTV